MPKLILILLFITGTQLSGFTQVKKNAQRIEEVLTYVEHLYVDSVNDDELTEAAIVAMLEKLDPHSRYLSLSEVRDANEAINGSFVGIGIRFQIVKDTLHVVATIPNGPSEKLGILAGDRIVSIEGESVAGVGLKNTQVREKLMGEMGTKVKVQIDRNKSKKPLDFVITRDQIPVYSVDCHYMIDAHTGYIKLSSFSRTTAEEIKASIEDLKNSGMQNLILDLQNNGGGLLHAAKLVSDEFLSGNKLIVYSEGRKQPKSELHAGSKGIWETGPLVILTNENTASASEIVSGAIQDWDRGLIVGRRSFGKGLVQRPISLSDGSQLRLTIARYYTPSGRFIQKPYDDLDAYKNDYMERYLNGELNNQDSIKFADSLKYETRVTKRTVYGGGGIMPDVFVPMDTTALSEYYKSLIRGGYFNTYSLSYVEKNRELIKKKYPNFADFKADENYCDEEFMDDFFAYVAQEDKTLSLVKADYKLNADYKVSEESIKTRLKALIAQNAWGRSEFFQIYNVENDALKVALETIRSQKYETMNLAK